MCDHMEPQKDEIIQKLCAASVNTRNDGSNVALVPTERTLKLVSLLLVKKKSDRWSRMFVLTELVTGRTPRM